MCAGTWLCTKIVLCVGVEPGGEEARRDLVGLGAQRRRLLRHGDRVQVDDAVDRLVLALQPHPVADRAEIVAEVQIAARLDAGEDPPLHGLPSVRSADADVPGVIGMARAAVKRGAGAAPSRSSPRSSAPESLRQQPGSRRRRPRSAAPAPRAGGSGASQGCGEPERRRHRERGAEDPRQAPLEARDRAGAGRRGAGSQASRPALSQAESAVASAMPTCASGHDQDQRRARGWRRRQPSAILTGVRVSSRAKKPGASTLIST